VYVATWGGLGISADGGASFTNKSFGTVGIRGVSVYGNAVYVGTWGNGLSVSHDGGATFGAPYNSADGLPNDYVASPYLDGTKLYLPCGAGLAISQ
jgi:hypothetical protein